MIQPRFCLLLLLFISLSIEDDEMDNSDNRLFTPMSDVEEDQEVTPAAPEAEATVQEVMATDASGDIVIPSNWRAKCESDNAWCADFLAALAQQGLLPEVITGFTTPAIPSQVMAEINEQCHDLGNGFEACIRTKMAAQERRMMGRIVTSLVEQVDQEEEAKEAAEKADSANDNTLYIVGGSLAAIAIVVGILVFCCCCDMEAGGGGGTGSSRARKAARSLKSARGKSIKAKK